ncbi:MAG: LPS assembly protein LptD [Desulfobulbaceae bacterium]|nr:LPS assembly protein LptD [Desulfobulbaceae bacterium]
MAARNLHLRRRCYRLAIGLGLFCLLAGTGHAAAPVQEPWEITADRITRFKDPDIVIAEGNVILHRSKKVADGDLTVIKADWMRYDVNMGTVKARGNLSLTAPAQDVRAETARLDLNNQTGTVIDGTLTLDHGDYALRIAGHEMIKTGPDTYEIKDSRVTTCPAQEGKTLPWAVESRDVRVKKEGMAVLQPATLLIRETPALYTPYLTFPAKTKRESGFLTPELSTGERDGLGMIAPYFVNLSPSSDATLYPGYLAERGLVAGAEFRYVADARSRGTFGLNYLHDKKVDTATDDFNEDGILRGDQNRYWVRGKADHDFGDRTTGKLDLDVVSDQDFLQEFRKGMSGFELNDRQAQHDFNRGYDEETVTQRKSIAQLTKSWSAVNMLANMTLVQDAREHRSAVTPVQTVPRVQFNGRQQIGESRTSAVWNAEYLYYYRKRGLGYHRADLYPKLVWSIPRGYFEGTVSGGVRETMYLAETHGDPALASWNHSDSQNRTVQDYDINVASPWLRDFALHLGDTDTLTHTLRPQLIYGYTPGVDQSTLPHIDGRDRIGGRNQITYAWNNYFQVAGTSPEGGNRKRALGQFNLQQTYNIREANRDLTSATDKNRPYSDILLETELAPWAGLNLSYDSAWSVYDQGNTYHQILAGYNAGERNRLSASYTFQKNPALRKPFFYSGVTPNSERKLTASLDSKLTETVALRGTVDQRRQAGNNHLDQTLQLIYQPACWGATLLWSNTDEDQRIALMFSLTGIGDFAGIGFAGEGGMEYDLF